MFQFGTASFSLQLHYCLQKTFVLDNHCQPRNHKIRWLQQHAFGRGKGCWWFKHCMKRPYARRKGTAMCQEEEWNWGSATNTSPCWRGWLLSSSKLRLSSQATLLQTWKTHELQMRVTGPWYRPDQAKVWWMLSNMIVKDLQQKCQFCSKMNVEWE